MTETLAANLLGSQAFSGERLSLPARGRSQVPSAAVVGCQLRGLDCSTLGLLFLTNLGRDVVEQEVTRVSHSELKSISFGHPAHLLSFSIVSSLLGKRPNRRVRRLFRSL